jgi:hypothetical protein
VREPGDGDAGEKRGNRGGGGSPVREEPIGSGATDKMQCMTVSQLGWGRRSGESSVSGKGEMTSGSNHRVHAHVLFV